MTERILVGVTGEKQIVKVGENGANPPGKGLLACLAHLEEKSNIAAPTAASPRAALLRGSIGAAGIVARLEGKGGVGRLAENEDLRAEGGAVDDQGGSGTAVATVAVAVLRR